MYFDVSVNNVHLVAVSYRVQHDAHVVSECVSIYLTYFSEKVSLCPMAS